MYLESERLIIRDFAPDDTQDLQEIFGDEETMANCEPAYTLEKNREISLRLLYRPEGRRRCSPQRQRQIDRLHSLPPVGGRSV